MITNQVWRSGRGGRVLKSCIEAVETRGTGRELEVFARSSRAGALLALGEVGLGLKEAELAVRLCDQRGNVVAASQVRSRLAEALIVRAAPGDLDRAAAVFDQAEEIARDAGQIPDLVRAGLARARLAAASGDGAAREALLAEALTLAREIDARGFVTEIEAERSGHGPDTALTRSTREPSRMG